MKGSYRARNGQERKKVVHKNTNYLSIVRKQRALERRKNELVFWDNQLEQSDKIETGYTKAQILKKIQAAEKDIKNLAAKLK